MKGIYIIHEGIATFPINNIEYIAGVTNIQDARMLFQHVNVSFLYCLKDDFTYAKCHTYAEAMEFFNN